MLSLLILSSGIVMAYTLLIFKYMRGWDSIPEFMSSSVDLDLTVTVIVVFRDEENNLPSLLKALQKQSFPKLMLEMIFVDDHSGDHSAEIVLRHIEKTENARLIHLKNPDSGKKKALALAAMEAKGSLLLFTDADCIPGPDWVSSIVSFYLEKRPVLIAAPVVILPGTGFFSRFQALEFLSLIGSTAGSFGAGNPVMVNGANLAAEKNAYLESIDYIETRTPSGDDLFLMLRLKKNYPGRLMFLKSRKSIVTTRPHTHFTAFLQQRLRWVSKSKFYRDKSVITAAVIVFLINLWLLNCFIMSFFNPSYLFFAGGLLLAKSMADFIFLRKVLKFFRMEGLMKIFVLSQIVYFLYVSFTGIAGNLTPPKWKGRTKS